MSFLGTVFGRTSLEDSPVAWVNQDMIGRTTTSGQRVTAQGALALAAYYACLRVVSEDTAALPLRVHRRVSATDSEPVPDHIVDLLLHQAPNNRMIPISFREMLTHWAMGWGMGCGWIQRDGTGRPVEITPIHPDRITMGEENGQRVYDVQMGVIDEKSGQRFMRIEARDMLHISAFGGYALSALAAESIGVGLAVEQFGGSFFGNGATPGSVLEHPGKLKPEAKQNLKNSVQEDHTGRNAHKTLVLEEGIKWHQLSIPPEQAQFIATSQHSVETVCRWCRVAPHKIQHLLRSTYNNIEQQSIEHVSDTLMPWAIRWEQEGNRKLFMPEEKKTHFIKHNFKAMLRGDANTRAAYYRQLWGIGVFTQNKILRLEDENGIGPLGDQRFVPANMQTLERAIAAPQITAGKEPGGAPQDNTPREEMRAAFAPLFEEAVARVVHKEIKALARAAKRYAGDPETFSGWVQTFLHEQARYFEEAVEPIAESLARLTSGALNGHAQAWSARYADESWRALGSLAEISEQSIGAITADWAERRPRDLADEMIGELIP